MVVEVKRRIVSWLPWPMVTKFCTPSGREFDTKLAAQISENLDQQMKVLDLIRKRMSNYG